MKALELIAEIKKIAKEQSRLESELAALRRVCEHENGDQSEGFIYCKHCRQALKFSK